jgi:hypothetical protein
MNKILLSVVFGTAMLGTSLYAGGLPDGEGDDEILLSTALRLFKHKAQEEFVFPQSHTIDSSRKFVVASQTMDCTEEDLDYFITLTERSMDLMNKKVPVSWDPIQVFHESAIPGRWWIRIPLKTFDESKPADDLVISFKDLVKFKPKEVIQPQAATIPQTVEINHTTASGRWLGGQG